MFRLSRVVSSNIAKGYTNNSSNNGFRGFYQREINRMFHNNNETKYHEVMRVGSGIIGIGLAINACNENDRFNREYYDKYEGYVSDKYYDLYMSGYRHTFSNFEKFIMSVNGFTIGYAIGHTYSISVPLIGLSYFLYQKNRDKFY